MQQHYRLDPPNMKIVSKSRFWVPQCAVQIRICTRPYRTSTRSQRPLLNRPSCWVSMIRSTTTGSSFAVGVTRLLNESGVHNVRLPCTANFHPPPQARDERQCKLVCRRVGKPFASAAAGRRLEADAHPSPQQPAVCAPARSEAHYWHPRRWIRVTAAAVRPAPTRPTRLGGRQALTRPTRLGRRQARASSAIPD